MTSACPASKTDPPKADELEVSLFGPGKGECIVVHLGSGDLMIIDSFLVGGKPVALEYLRSLNVDVAKHVKLVVVSHWHDDHIRGVSDIVREAVSGEIVLSAALMNEEFFTLVGLQDGNKMVANDSGLSEFSELLEVLNDGKTGRYRVGPDRWVVEGVALYKHPVNAVEVMALSPSSQTLTDAQGELAKLIPKAGAAVHQFVRPEPNRLSVVIHVSFPKGGFLLGGDLEVGADNRRGWKAIVQLAVQPEKAGVFKIAHHGSPYADFDGVWQQLLVQTDPVAIIAPYAGGRTPRPSASDAKRILSRTSEAYCTIWPLNFQPVRRKSVATTLKNATRWHRAVATAPGHIRVRATLNDPDLRLKLIDGASKLC